MLWALARSLLASGAFYASQWERRSALRDLPVLILWGMKDRAFGPTFLARWQQLAPHAMVEEIAEAGHWPHEESPERVINAFRAFLRTNQGRGPRA